MTATGIPDTTVTPAATQIFSGTARLNDTDITSASNANTAIARLDAGLEKIADERATYGAVINRLTYAGDNLTNVAQNTTESRSRILDTDYAKASSELARTQIISQAATAMLAQANQSPQSVLKLLQG
jgi:flagellin